MKVFFAELKKLLSGRDGEFSVRRIFGALFCIVGPIMQAVAEPPVTEGTWAGLFSIAGLIIAGLGAALLMGVTAQHILDGVKAKKGGGV